MSASTTWRAGRRLLIAACVIAMLLIPAAAATPGALDPSFGVGGEVTTAIGPSTDRAYALVRQPDGKLVAAGYAKTGSKEDFALARYDVDGNLDGGFGAGGKVTTAVRSHDDFVNALALQPDGSVIAAGDSSSGTDYDFALARYSPDGKPDSTFGSGGSVTTVFGPGDDEVLGVVVQPDGKIVAAGSAWDGSRYEFALTRYTPEGKLDPSFGPGGTGKVLTPVGDSGGANALALQPDGKLVAAGAVPVASNWDFALARYNPDGSLDTSFNGTGAVTTPIGPGTDSILAVVRQPDGKLVAAGYASNGSNADFALARYTSDGKLDSGFGSGGKVTTPIGAGADMAQAVGLQPDGKVVAAGYSYNGAQTESALARYEPDGTLDPGFGSGGKVTTAFEFIARAVALQPDGKVVAAGSASNGSDDDFALVRYLGGSTLAVAKAGSGSGSVTSAPGGIDCGSTCAAGFDSAPVTLTATPDPGSSFSGWSGACSGSGLCTVPMSADQSVTAVFERDKTLTLTRGGSGTGVVSSNPAGISCGSTCEHAFAHGTTVTLTAVAAPTSRFAGWSGPCSGTASCTVSMSAARSLTASFEALCIVPKLKGKSLRGAKLALEKAHCALGRLTRAYSAKVKKGRVLSQSARPGSKLAPGAKVKLKLSKGKRT